MAEILHQPNHIDFQRQLEVGFDPQQNVAMVDQLIGMSGVEAVPFPRYQEARNGLMHQEANWLTDNFKAGVETAQRMAAELLQGKTYNWWDIDAYRQRMASVYEVTSPGQFVAVLGPYALNRVAGSGPIMIANNHDLFPEGDNLFIDGLTNATVTNLGQGFPPQALAVNTLNRLTGGTQCVPYHPGPLMEQAANALLNIMPIDTRGAKVAWFNSGGDAVSVGIAAAEKYMEMTHGENGRRKAVYFKEAYHGNIEGRAGRATSGINAMFHQEDRNSIELEYPNLPEEVNPVLQKIQELVDQKKVSCVVFESTQGDGGGVSMHPDFFVQLVKLSLDKQIPLICDEVQSGFGRSGRVFDVEYLLDHWRNSSYVTSGQYPEKPPMIMAVAKSMTNGAISGSAVVLPKEYAVLKRAEGLNTYSALPATMAATIITSKLMQPEFLSLVNEKRAKFEQAVQPYIRPDGIIRGIRGHGLHLFLEVKGNQVLQVELIGRKRILTGTVARDALRVHAPINAPDDVWQALATTIGETAQAIERGEVSPQTLQILAAGPSGLAER